MFLKSIKKGDSNVIWLSITSFLQQNSISNKHQYIYFALKNLPLKALQKPTPSLRVLDDFGEEGFRVLTKFIYIWDFLKIERITWYMII